ncbi:MAG: hypothetical protein HQL64_17180 [Magnetococcales bacterium]|nr:hypothetical protein [Magnetococcales bacterium]
MIKKRFLSLVIAAISWIFLTGEGLLEGWLDCKSKASPTHDAICADKNLMKLYRKVIDTTGSIISVFVIDEMDDIIEANTIAWLSSCDDCDGSVVCLENEFKKRLAMFNGRDPDHPYTGTFYVERLGRMALYPIGDEYLVGISTAFMTRWTCWISAVGVRKGDKIFVTQYDYYDEDTMSFWMIPIGSSSMVIEDNPKIWEVQKIYCGLNGLFSGKYVRVPMPNTKFNDGVGFCRIVDEIALGH